MIIWLPEVEVNERKGSQIVSGDQWVCLDGFEQSYADRMDSHTSS